MRKISNTLSKSGTLFSINSTRKNGRQIFHITWQSNPIDKQAFDLLRTAICEKRDYAPITNAKLADFSLEVDKINKQGHTVTVDQAIAIRSIVLKDKIISGHVRIDKLIKGIASKYTTQSILDLSFAYDYPPLSLLRAIFLHLGINKQDLYEVFANRRPASEVLTGRNLLQYYTAEANDAESTFNQQQVAVIAAENELIVTQFFRKLGIGLVDQEQLVKTQIELYGRAILTPDILFTDEVYINNVRVNWIDYKDYIGTSIYFLRHSNIQQSAKYTREWGPGALCYHRAFVVGLHISGSILLDARSLSLRLKC